MSDDFPFSKVALVGVPNVGKSTIFNQLTGLTQKTGNFPGVTVDKKSGILNHSGRKIEIIDLPGSYNIYPRSEDETVVFQVLCEDRLPEAVVAILDASNLERGLFFALQIIDLGYPMALVLNMDDEALSQGKIINKVVLARLLGIPVISTTATHAGSVERIKEIIGQGRFAIGKTSGIAEEILGKAVDNQDDPRRQFELYHILQRIKVLGTTHRAFADLDWVSELDIPDIQRIETRLRYDQVRGIISKALRAEKVQVQDFTRRIDRVLLDPYAGFAIFLAILFLVFQAIFNWATIPMEWIDRSFAFLSQSVQDSFPPGALTDLISQGILPGLGGIVIFIPQIALLFGFLGFLEGSGYMARAVFITDRLMRPFGLNGRSVVPLISGLACAIPAIMATRSIANRKDKLITIFVTPFMSCSARLPVYIILIGILFPNGNEGFFNPSGTALFFMYLLGIAAALASAYALKLLMKSRDGGGLVLELPRYRLPSVRDVVLQMYEKSKTFVLEAGKVILAISVVLWVLASYGPPEDMEVAENLPSTYKLSEGETAADLIASRKLEASYAGHLGRIIEPVIAPLGYDWKIGIALIASFAAREVFVSTVATLYALGSEAEETETLQEKLRSEKRSDGTLVYNHATVWSLLVFYAFAMQCMSTVAVVYRETKSIKWPLLQTVYMTVFAYLSALIVYQILS